MSYGPYEKLSDYMPPGDLISVRDEAKCKTDVTITILEPWVKGTNSNEPEGFSWGGVKGVSVTLSGNNKSMNAITDGDGLALFKSVPCGNYEVMVAQVEFIVEILDSIYYFSSKSSITVSSGSKNGCSFDIKVKRQLWTVEVFRLPTQYWTALEGGVGKPIDTDQDPYGHHWVKIYTNTSDMKRQVPKESYGWWPIEAATADKLWSGVRGSLNGYPVHSSFPKRDPYHTQYKRRDKKLEDVFFPYVTNGKTAQEYKNNIAKWAFQYKDVSNGIWSWRGNSAGYHCKTFQTYLMRNAYFWKRVGIGVGNLGWSASTE